MLDDQLTPWLIEVNTNPCLELSSPLLARIIPSMLDNALKYHFHRIAVDPFFPEPSSRRAQSQEVLSENKFELIFHEEVDGRRLIERLGERAAALQTDDPALRDVDEEPLQRPEMQDTDGC